MSRKELIAAWRELPGSDRRLVEDLICEELNAEADASELNTRIQMECWLRSRCPMPRLRIATDFGERLVPWYAILEIRTDPSFRIMEIFLSGGVICRIVSNRGQEELYANLQLERVKVIHPVQGVTVMMDDPKPKVSDSDFS